MCHTFVLTNPLSSCYTAKFRCFDKSQIAPNDIVLSWPSLVGTVRSYSISTLTFLPIAIFLKDSLLSQAYGSPCDSLPSRLFPSYGALTLERKIRTVFWSNSRSTVKESPECTSMTLPLKSLIDDLFYFKSAAAKFFHTPSRFVWPIVWAYLRSR